MRHLAHILEDLLSDHDCVVVPGLGGFLMNRTDASYDGHSYRITPSYRQVSFNSQLTFNDGLLIQAYQQSDGISYNEAFHNIRQAVAEILQHLSAGESLQLGNIGSLKQEEDGRMVFTPSRFISLDADAFGLESIACPSIVSIARLHEPKPSDVEKQESPVFDTAIWKWAVSVAACIFLAVAFPSRPLMPQGEHAIHYASVVSPCIIAQHIVRQEEPVTETENHNNAPAEVKPEVRQKNSEQQYLLIIASFQTREEAERYMSKKQVRESFPSAGVAMGGDRYRVFAEGYSTKQEAVGRIPSFRADYPNYAKAWVTLGKPL